MSFSLGGGDELLWIQAMGAGGEVDHPALLLQKSQETPPRGIDLV